MRSYRLNSHSKYDLKVHLIWIHKYRKRVLTGHVAERTRDILRQICMEHEIHIVSGKAAPDYVHSLFPAVRRWRLQRWSST